MQNKLLDYTLKRYPETTNKSLRAWSNAELLVAEYVKNTRVEDIHVFNDRFGVWNCLFNKKNITTVWTYASQKKAVSLNLNLNNLPEQLNYKTPLENINTVELALIKMPKSLELFELFLSQIHKNVGENVEVVCGFMTKHFSTSYLRIAESYFEEVTQTKAWKKSRLLLLKSPKKREEKDFLNKISWKNSIIKQYYGVFSSGKIDIGTQFLLEHLKLKLEELNVLDVASGNGIIAHEIIKQNSKVNVTLVDDFNLAIASSELNVSHEKSTFVCSDTLDVLNNKSFDLVVSNPPFHFEHENNIEVAYNLFKGVEKCLKNNGRFVLVSNKHLNYKIELKKLFTEVSVLSSNKKFEIIECLKF